MAVDLPPPMSPQLGSAEQVQQGAARVTFESHGYQVHVFGARALGPEAVKATVAGADTISNGLRALASAYYQAGYPAARLTYAVNRPDVYVLVTLGGVSAVQADAPLDKYFEDLAGATPLTAGDLEQRRLLASMHADRMGLTGTTQLAADGEATSLTVKTGPGGPDPTLVSVQFANPGNRYVGRYFLDLDLVTGTEAGDEIHVLTRTTLTGLDSDMVGDGEFWEETLGINRVTPQGIFGIGARYIGYRFDLDPVTPLNGQIWIGELRWQYPLLADFDSRLTSQLKLDRTSKTTELALTGQDAQLERYTSAEGSLTYQQSGEFLGRSDLETGLIVRKGLTQGTAQVPPAGLVPELDYLLYRAAFIFRIYANNGMLFSLETSGQYSGDVLPEQQQLVLGGMEGLSSSLPGLAVGDSGFLARLTGASAVYDLFGLQTRLRLFVGAGSTHSNTYGGSPGLADAGGALDLSIGAWLEGSVSYAEGIGDQDLPEQTLEAADADVYFRIKVKF